MGTGIVTEDERERLVQFLQHRQFNSRMIEVLKNVKERNQLKKGDVTVAKNATYGAIVESLDKALKNDWLSREELVRVLGEAEIAGRQHVSLYRVKPSKVSGLARTLTSPRKIRTALAKLEEFWEIPRSSFARVVHNDGDFVIVKVVAPRTYHSIETVDDEVAIPDIDESTEYELFVRLRHTERSAIILKLDRQNHLLQTRVPPREHGSGDTPKRVYDIAMKALSTHYNVDGILSALSDSGCRRAKRPSCICRLHANRTGPCFASMARACCAPFNSLKRSIADWLRVLPRGRFTLWAQR